MFFGFFFKFSVQLHVDLRKMQNFNNYLIYAIIDISNSPASSKKKRLNIFMEVLFCHIEQNQFPPYSILNVQMLEVPALTYMGFYSLQALWSQETNAVSRKWRKPDVAIEIRWCWSTASYSNKTKQKNSAHIAWGSNHISTQYYFIRCLVNLKLLVDIRNVWGILR